MYLNKIYLHLLVLLFFTTTTQTTSAQYTVVPQRALLGWSYELVNINRIHCLLACLRKIYCLSVNYNHQDKLCHINQRQQDGASSLDSTTTGNFQQLPLFEYIEKVLDKDLKEHGVHFSAGDFTYKEAYDICMDNLGSLASYEHLYNAFRPRLENCTKGWLISGEIAFTELNDKCILRPPVQRSNIFPCKSYYSGYYCYREYNHSHILNSIPINQRIVRLTGSNAIKLNRGESESCCSKQFGGRLATPFEVYYAWYSTGAGLCVESWQSHGLAGDPCTPNIPSKFWLYPFGDRIMLVGPMRELFGMCNIPQQNQNLTFPDGFPSHRVINVEGIARYTLTYQAAKARCIDHGGRLSTRAELQNALNAGYDSCHAGWVKNGEVIYPITHPRTGCGPSRMLVSWGFRDRSHSFNGYCYIP